MSRSRSARRPRVLAAALAACLLVASAAVPVVTQASTTGVPAASAMLSVRYCDRVEQTDAIEQDRMLRFAAIVRDRLETGGGDAALISRSGVDLQRFRTRFSHAGIALRDAGELRWSVRQLYYACDEGRPRLFDQGVAGFLFNTDEPAVGYVSIVWPPRPQAASLAVTARDDTRALRLLAARYSANSFPFSTRYQNCNQWVMELLASAWGDLSDGEDLRARAQGWLADNRYVPTTLEVDSHWLKFASGFVPLLHFDDHPEDERLGLQVRLSLPEAMETFVRDRLPASRRIELCHARGRVVIREGWTPIEDGCVARDGDEVIALD